MFLRKLAYLTTLVVWKLLEELFGGLKRLHFAAWQHSTLLQIFSLGATLLLAPMTHFASALSLSSCSSPTSRPIEVSNPAYLSDAPYNSWSKVVPVMGTPFCSPLPFSAMLAKAGGAEDSSDVPSVQTRFAQAASAFSTFLV